VSDVFVQDKLSNLLLDFKLHFHFSKPLFQLMLQTVGFLLELVLHSLYSLRVDPVLGTVLHHLVHLDYHLCAKCDFVYHLALLSDVMILVGAKKCAVSADASAVLNTDDF
jgi:hypothetical protein